ncbi:MAG: anthranilate synthase component I family protein [Deltaproteobacteria bacterium]|nr:anthranilate synthase component I family protein [Deltaproteobacteria bacterium]
MVIAAKNVRIQRDGVRSPRHPLVVARFPAFAPCPSTLLGFGPIHGLHHTEIDFHRRHDGGVGDHPVILRSGHGARALTGWSYGSLEPVSVHSSIEQAWASLRDWAWPPIDAADHTKYGDGADDADDADGADRSSSDEQDGHPVYPPFIGGAVGYISYDEGFATQARPRAPRRSTSGLPGSWFGLYDAIYARNEATQEGLVLAQPTAGAIARAERLAQCLTAGIKEGPRPPALTGRLVGSLDAPVSQRVHQQRIREALDLIGRGEIYQVNLVCPRRGRYRGTPAAAFRRLLDQGAPPFSAYLAIDLDRTLVSASPECFLDVHATSRTATTFPIKGTRARSEDMARDRALAMELLASEKDLAEHRMIVDLLRNDLGRLADIPSVVVERCAYLESFPTVHHLTSAIRATLPSRFSAVDLLRSMFPGGSITGVPKLRAMEIIDALEDAPRGVSMGTIAYLGPDGAMRASVAIRTAEFVHDEVTFMVGGGIVADSDPGQEWIETEIKAQSLARALDPARSNPATSNGT